MKSDAKLVITWVDEEVSIFYILERFHHDKFSRKDKGKHKRDE